MEATVSLHDAALELIERGVPIVVCDGKVPLGGERWHEREVTAQSLPGLMRQASCPAIGVKLGPGSVIDIEADSEDEEALFAKLFEGCDAPVTPTYASKRGKHRLFQFDNRFVGLNRAVVNYRNGNGAKLGIRIGADGKATQSVIPPSRDRHWIVSWDEVEPAPLPDMVVERIREATRPARRELVTVTSSHNGQSTATAERARKYLAKVPPAISGAGGHDQTFHAACVLVQGFSLDRGPALALLSEWNQTCQPPWSDGELEHKIDDALSLPGERGYLLNDESTSQHSGQPKSERAKSPTQNEQANYHLTDLGNAERFAAQHGADVRFCHAWRKWLTWDGRRWRIDDSGEVMRRAKLTARSIYVEAAAADEMHEVKALAKWAADSERRDRLTAMISLAESEQPIPISVESLDADPWLLNTENGTIDLRTGELRPHRRDDFLTKCCPLEYPTEAGVDPDLWLSVLDRIFAGNDRLIGFLRRLIGMALVGEVFENVLPIFHGTGANGKSVSLETVCGMLGPDYAMAASTSLLMVDRMGRHPTERTDLFGRRLVAANETGDGGRLSEETVKQLTSRESIRARRMREDSWEFKPSHTVILSTNHMPEVRGTDYGIWRRLRLIPFNVVIPEDERDEQLANKLQSEWPAILRWAVGGCIEWQRSGLNAPEEVLAATNDYRADQDILGEWIADRCVTGPGCDARSSDLYKSYKQWADERGEHVHSQTKIGRRLGERGFTRGRDSRNRVTYVGIGLPPEGPEGSEGFQYESLRE